MEPQLDAVQRQRTATEARLPEHIEADGDRETQIDSSVRGNKDDCIGGIDELTNFEHLQWS